MNHDNCSDNAKMLTPISLLLLPSFFHSNTLHCATELRLKGGQVGNIN